jgi:RNA polymerase sigma-70 factor (ECF subfamily)
MIEPLASVPEIEVPRTQRSWSDRSLAGFGFRGSLDQPTLRVAHRWRGLQIRAMAVAPPDVDMESKDQAFLTHLEPHRRAITLHSYRMLGSLHDAEEIAQESLLRGWERLDELKSTAAAKTWLYRIATNACLDLLKSRRRRALPHDLAPPASPGQPAGQPAHDGSWIEPAPDGLFEAAADPQQHPDVRASTHEDISLAFITALQLLPPKQRAALLLVDVLGWRPSESAELLQTSETSVNSLLQRARKNLEQHRAEPPPPLSPENAATLRRFVTAFESRDLETFTALLAEDAILSMPPQPEWYRGRSAIAQWFAGFLAAAPARFRLLPTRANGLPAVGVYAASTVDGPYEAVAVTLFSVDQGRVSRITKFGMPQLFPSFGLARQLPPDAPVF